MKRLWRVLGTVTALVALGAVLAWFAGFMHPRLDTATVAPLPGDGPAGSKSGPHVVEAAAVDEPVLATQTGTLRPRQEVTVAARITGAVTAVHVRAGDTVSAGDVLVELDARALGARLAQAGDAAAVAAARLEEARLGHARVRDLFERKALSKAEFDASQASLRAAQAEFARAENQTDEATTALSYAVITAPIGGRITERRVDPGDTAVPAQPLVRLYDPSVMRIEAHVRESLARTLAPGARLTARVDGVEGDVAVTIDEVVPTADPGSRSFLVKGVLQSDTELFPGMFGRLLIPAGTVRRIVVPASAVWRVGQLDYVSVLVGPGRVTRRFVRVGGARADGRVEIRSGLDAGESVLVNGA